MASRVRNRQEIPPGVSSGRIYSVLSKEGKPVQSERVVPDARD